MYIYKRKGSSLYWMKFTFNGKLIQKSTKCKNKRDAEVVASAYRTQLVMGEVGIQPTVKAPNFTEAADDYLERAKIERSQKPASYRRYENACRPLKRYFGKKSVDQIKESDIEKYQQYRINQVSRATGKPITSGTVNFETIRLKTIFKRLVQNNILRQSPAANIKALPANDANFHVITEIEEKQYLLACPQPLRDIATIMIEAGMRPSEVYLLRRDHIAIDQNYLQVVGGKTEASNRRVYLTEKACEILRNRLEQFKGVNLFPFKEIDGNRPTDRMTPDEIYKLKEQVQSLLSSQHHSVLKKTELKFRLYDARHTFATRAVHWGINLRTLADLLGHAGLKEVMRYAHVSDDQKEAAIRHMDKIKKAA